MPGILYVIATPIGNLEDVTLRGLRILREVSVIAAEDTRRTARLLQHYSISTPTTSLHEHNERAKAASLVRRLAVGDSIALVSDAGTPGISDPGTELVRQAHAAGIRVEPIPGPNAAVATLSASGLGGGAFVFCGFPPAKSKARRDFLQRLASESRPMIFYEAPHRIVATLQGMLDVLGDRPIAIGRELTKAHEELVVRPISLHLEAITAGRGEYTLVVGPLPESADTQVAVTDDDLVAEFGQMTASGDVSRREAVKQLAARHKRPAREVYRIVQSI